MALNFPAKIYQILENESSDIIRWHMNGTAFRIVDHGRFEREIIPKYFRHNQISSVQRQLNLYGFKCISRGEDKGAFFHQKFRRGDWEEVKRITRYSPNKKGGDDKLSEGFPLKVEPATKSLDSVIAAAESMYNQIVQTPSQSTFPVNPAPLVRYPSFTYNNGSHVSSNTSKNSVEFPFLPNPSPNNWYNGVASSPEYPILVPPPGNNADVVQSNEGGVASVLPEVASSSVLLPQVKAHVNAEAVTGGVRKNAVKVVNDVVTIDPYFDFENEFDFLCDAMSEVHDSESTFVASPSVASSMSVVPTSESVKLGEPVCTAEGKPEEASSKAVSAKVTCEIGINTDLSQANVGPLAAELMFMFPRSY